MPHNREDQRNLFAPRRAPIEERERTPVREKRERDERAAAARQQQERDDTVFLGSDPRSPLAIFNREGEPEARSLSGAALQQVGAGFSAALEFGREAVGALGRRKHQFPTSIDVIDSIRETFGELEKTPDTQLSKRKGKGEGPNTSAAAIQRQSDFLEVKKTRTIALLDDLALGSDDPTAQHAREQVIEEKELELAQIEVDLLELQDNLDVQNVIFEVQVDNAGLSDSIDITRLESALTEEEGVIGPSTYDAIQELATNAALSEKERNEAIDLILTRQNFTHEIISTISDLVENRDDLTELLARFDTDELFDPALFLNPTLQFNVTGDNDSARFLSNMHNTVDGLFEAPLNIPDGDESFAEFDAMLLGAMQFGVNDQDVQTLIQSIAQAWDLQETDIQTALEQSLTIALENKEIYDSALDADSLIPGSRGMISAIYQAGELIGYDPEMLELASMSKALHALIEVKSKGISGRKGEGTIAGMGGLTLDMYDDLMPQPWSPTQGLSYELQALLEYIRQKFGGDALKALTFWRDSGEWGGTESFPSG